MDVKVLGSGRSLLGDEDNVLSASVRAGLSALSKAGLSASDIDCIVCVTSSFRPTNFSARTVKHHLGIFTSTCRTQDLQGALLSIPHHIETLKGEVEAGKYKNILVVGTDGSRMRLNWNLTDLLPLLGEVAWAFLLGRPAHETADI